MCLFIPWSKDYFIDYLYWHCFFFKHGILEWNPEKFYTIKLLQKIYWRIQLKDENLTDWKSLEGSLQDPTKSSETFFVLVAGVVFAIA